MDDNNIEPVKQKKNKRGLKAILGIALGILVVSSFKSKKPADGRKKTNQDYDPEQEIGL